MTTPDPGPSSLAASTRRTIVRAELTFNIIAGEFIEVLRLLRAAIKFHNTHINHLRYNTSPFRVVSRPPSRARTKKLARLAHERYVDLNRHRHASYNMMLKHIELNWGNAQLEDVERWIQPYEAWVHETSMEQSRLRGELRMVELRYEEARFEEAWGVRFRLEQPPRMAMGSHGEQLLLGWH
ncbi:hypothetical protein SLS56_010423 [Neofusicoccum ribis]|uniref:Uncharacterized protein n=1 Tax=Neofusicoccum ribis TaxID=45134 RepID=A0ABR3SEH4_9PEZI